MIDDLLATDESDDDNDDTVIIGPVRQHIVVSNMD